MADTFKMVDLRRPKESLRTKNVGKISPDPYSYEHRISLDQDSLDKLGMDIPKTGDKLHVMGHAEVKSVSQNDHGGEGGKTSRVELQFKRMALRPKSKDDGGLRGAVDAGIKQGSSDD